MQKVYFKRLTRQDITRSVAITAQSVENFWGVDPSDTTSYTPIKICHINNPEYYPEGITIHKGNRGEKDWRICGNEWKGLYAEDNPEVDDIMVIRKHDNNKFSVEILKKGTSEHTFIDSLFKDGDNYLLSYTDLTCKESNLFSSKNKPSLQQIFYGAPGTGKSYTIKKMEDGGLKCIRTTFHPDSDYSTFVGAYKPHRVQGSEKLTYEFVAQAFLQAYTIAWQELLDEESVPTKEIALVIEEINRGNCAQIFGDIFQLLDRDTDGWSTYPIKADTDIKEYLETLKISGYSDKMKERYGEDKEGCGYLALPPNMSILATMNTSDQSLFPIDSAFKRRWEWKYIPICKGKKDGEDIVWEIETTANNKNWWDFIRSINVIIENTTHSEDKELGFFFCKPSGDTISKEMFVNKVVFYLWNDVFKTYGFRSDIFDMDEDGTRKITFRDFFNKNGDINEDTLARFINNVMKHLPADEETDSALTPANNEDIEIGQDEAAD